MSRVFGFLSGVTMSLSMAYFFVEEIKTKAGQAKVAIAHTEAVLAQTTDRQPRVIVVPQPHNSRDSVAETMKDLWDEEIEKGARWVMGVDVERWSRNLAGNLWDKFAK
ncbi:uncharacterized protein V1510DRAFT_410176 [Dipodascopsis tothii]|uniref:uncharacterized protein n=1 Tax=Dipodascopsis tothii TaxID=44089 RepID=UPI0034CD47B9